MARKEREVDRNAREIDGICGEVRSRKGSSEEVAQRFVKCGVENVFLENDKRRDGR